MKVFVLPTEADGFGPLDGPFFLSLEPDKLAKASDEEAELLATLVSFVRHVASGVSCYNKSAIEESSNLTSFAAESWSDLISEAPEMAAKLENLVIDCAGLPDSVKAHPIWRLDRAILRVLPGVKFVD